MRLRLRIEPRPVSTWGVNFSSRPDLCQLVFKKPWFLVSQQVKREANYTCEVCGEKKADLFCHEVWEFDDRKKVQYLNGLECCCKLCSDVHHFGRSSQVYQESYLEELRKHWCRVNQKERSDLLTYQEEIKKTSMRRADRSYIVKAGRRVLA